MYILCLINQTKFLNSTAPVKLNWPSGSVRKKNVSLNPASGCACFNPFTKNHKHDYAAVFKNVGCIFLTLEDLIVFVFILQHYNLK